MTREIVVFLPLSPDAAPMDTARALVDALHVARADVGEDLLTGAVTVRIGYSEALLRAAQTFLTQRDVPHEITTL